jgi:hypothetical protein
LRRFTGGESFGQRQQPRLELAAEDRLRAKLAQIGFVHRRVKTVETKVRPWIQLPDAPDETRREPGGGVHRHMEGDQIGGGDGHRIEPLDGQIEGGNIMAGLAQPRRRRRQSEGLATHLIGGDENDVQVSHEARLCGEGVVSSCGKDTHRAGLAAATTSYPQAFSALALTPNPSPQRTGRGGS